MIRVWTTFESFLSHELSGIQDCFSDTRKTIKDLLRGIDVSYTTLQWHIILVVTHVLGFTSDLSND